MWKVILVLWSIPVALGIAMATRIGRGSPAMTEDVWRLFFAVDQEANLTLSLGIKLALLALLLFFVGMAQGLILVNLGLLWVVMVPLATTLGVILILTQWLRSASNNASFPQRHDAAQSHPTENRTPGRLSR